MSETKLPVALAQARESFLVLVAGVRPELHRYCARLTGSVVDGEDVLQEALAKACYALSLGTDVPPLRPWLFRIAHNAAIDFLRRHDRSHVELVEETPEPAIVEQGGDALEVEVALAAYLALPITQRAAVILKDVLDHSLEEIAETLGTSVPAVKALLVRGRTRLRESGADVVERPALRARDLAALERYAARFNERDWDGLRALLAEECRLDLVSKAARRGREVGGYYGRYAAESVRVIVGLLEGRPALAALTPESGDRPAYFILVEFDGDRVSAIRDFRYVQYIARDAHFEPAA
jgi:RNA polymerase sigma-70 factor (ECF subfamily)